MRVPDARLHRGAIRMVGDARTRLEILQRQVATGKRLGRASDDPAATVGAQALRGLLGENDVYQRNIADALHWSAATEQPVQAVSELLARLKETALKGGDGAGADRAALGKLVDDLLQELVAQGNTTIGERSVFGGFDDHTPPYAASSHVQSEAFTAGAAGTSVDLANARLVAGSVVVTDGLGTTQYVEGVDYRVDASSGRLEVLAGGALATGTEYRASYDTETTSSVTQQAGDDGAIVRRIARNRLEAVNLTGAEVFGADGELFQIAIDLKNALWKDDTSRVRALIADLDTAAQRVGGMLGEIGARTDALEAQQSILESDQLTLQAHLSTLEDADMAAVVVGLQAQQNAYQAALAATARLFQIGLATSL